jgi:class 3 adenylate cyclase/tetratricopeptide (TPR) repeat protein
MFSGETRMPDANNLRTAIQALETQREQGILDDASADLALAALREQLRKLGERLPPESEAERKQITVMFADMSGFTALSERTDAEEVRALVNQCFEALGKVITRYGGHIDKFIGDELMVLFGAPVAIEDHAARALHAALELREKFAAFNQAHVTLRANPLALHTGVNSGLVVAGDIGTEAKREYTVMGDPVNVAARLVAQAAPGEILVGEQTRRLAGKEFDFEDLGSHALEGRARGLQVYRLQGLKEGGSEVQPTSSRRAMVGRQNELAVLQRTVREVAEVKRARAVAVVGAAGIGKSRLRDELRAWLDGERIGFSVLEGAALPHMTTTPYFIIADLLRKQLGVTHADSAASVRLQLETLLHELGTDDVETAHALASILAIDYENSELMKLSAEERRGRTFAALTAFIRRLTERAPVLLLMNDLHWVDELSLDILEHILTDLEDAAILIVTFTRPVLDPDARIRQVEARLAPEAYARLALQELNVSSSRELLLSLAPGLDRWPGAMNTILGKAQGNPFFIEEIVRSLLDGSVLAAGDEGIRVAGDLEQLSVPDTVWGVLAERIDRLPPEEKRTIQSAAIVGRVFWQGAVQELTRTECAGQLGRLSQREMVERIGPAPFAEDWEWKFRHALVQEVAYSSLLLETRKDGHLSAATWLERSAGDRLKEYSTVLAHHYQLGEDWGRAAQFAEMAGDRASDLYAHSEASAAYLQTLYALDQLDRDRANAIRRIDVTLRLGREASLYPTDEVFHALETAQQLATEIEDPRRQVRVLVALAAWRYISGQPRLAVELAFEAVASAKQGGLDELLVVPYMILAGAMFMTGRFRNCVDLIEQAQELAKLSGNDLDQRTDLGLGPNLALLGAAYQQLGEVERGRALGLESIRMAESLGDARGIALAHLFLGGTDAALGRFERCAEHLERAVALCEKAGEVTGTQTALGWLGRTLAWRGDLERGSDCLDRALQSADELGLVPFVPFLQAYRAELYIMSGRPIDGVNLATKAVDLALDTRQRSAEGEARRLLGWALFYAEGAPRERILNEFRSAVEIHRSCGGRVLLAIALFDLANFLKMTAQPGEAQPAEEEAEALWLSAELGLTWLPTPVPEPARGVVRRVN